MADLTGGKPKGGKVCNYINIFCTHFVSLSYIRCQFNLVIVVLLEHSHSFIDSLFERLILNRVGPFVDEHLYLYLYTIFDQRRLDIIDQVEHGRSPQQVTHLPPVCFTSPGIGTR